ncbi:hypothetical protein EGW08_014091 [Elysia chlorotica]|uniref:G-protein coupled receptors family 1 profile domain-containing protein n=1 Tax=Elysia chlorotica TaxID=188477 RepID=A0A3S0ZHY5_ELYCH|nr:hypothetical protein EGW08_014091 [Elysia chlorotica]
MENRSSPVFDNDSTPQNMTYLPPDDEDVCTDLYSFITVCISYVTIPISAVGICGNIVILITFTKIGFLEPINISYCALAVSDILGVLFLMWNSICSILDFQKSDIPFEALQISLPTGGAIFDIFNGTTAWLTAYVSLERCLCVVFPLKIKRILTHRKSIIVIASLFTIIGVPLLCANFILFQFEFQFDSETNRTVLNAKNLKDSSHGLYSFVYLYKFAVLNLLSLTIILVCSSILAVRVRRSAKFRMTASAVPTNQMPGADPFDDRTRRKFIADMRVSKIVLSIASISILLGCLNATRTLLVMVWPDFRPTPDHNIFIVASKLLSLLYLVNSSVNFFIFYMMGSKFRRTVQQLHCSLARPQK